MNPAAAAVLAVLTLSPGPGHPVCGRAVYDSAKAAAGGGVFVSDELLPGDEAALRMSEALLTTRAGLSSRGAVFARRHSVPAVAVTGAFWDDGALVVSEPVFGPEQCRDGACWRPRTGSRPRPVREGDALCVDAPGGRVTFVPAESADDRIAAAEAARAFEGLRDAAALERWLTAAASPARAVFLMEELVPRAVDGAASAAELERLRRVALSVAGAQAPRLKAAERAAFARARASAREELAGCAEDAADAASAAVLDRLTSRAAAQAGRVAQTARLLGESDGG
ncbi:MAG: PEP-utilizing enzyme, partial [Elusimicrobiota bacterium]|nr:PEP-utilizing enzyme [Elusimicrobiota bacterium]